MDALPLSGIAGPLVVAGFVAAHQPDAPNDGWYLVWQEGDDREHCMNLVRDADGRASWDDLEGEEMNAGFVMLVGVFHDDYFPRPSET